MGKSSWNRKERLSAQFYLEDRGVPGFMATGLTSIIKTVVVGKSVKKRDQIGHDGTTNVYPVDMLDQAWDIWRTYLLGAEMAEAEHYDTEGVEYEEDDADETPWHLKPSASAADRAQDPAYDRREDTGDTG